MKTLICTYQRPDGSTYSDSRRIGEAGGEDGAFRRLTAANKSARLISRRTSESTAVRVASERNTSVGENTVEPPKEDGREFHAGVQHGDAVGQLEDAVEKPVTGEQVNDFIDAARGAADDTFADVSSDPGDTPPDQPEEGVTQPSSPSRKTKK